MSIPTPYEFGSRPIAMFRDPHTYEYKQIMLTEDQSKELSKSLMEILSNNSPFVESDGFEVLVDDDVIAVHKKNTPITDFFTQEQIDSEDND